jgi:hypothetical protein
VGQDDLAFEQLLVEFLLGPPAVELDCLQRVGVAHLDVLVGLGAPLVDVPDVDLVVLRGVLVDLRERFVPADLVAVDPGLGLDTHQVKRREQGLRNVDRLGGEPFDDLAH